MTQERTASEEDGAARLVIPAAMRVVLAVFSLSFGALAWWLATGAIGDGWLGWAIAAFTATLALVLGIAAVRGRLSAVEYVLYSLFPGLS